MGLSVEAVPLAVVWRMNWRRIGPPVWRMNGRRIGPPVRRLGWHKH